MNRSELEGLIAHALQRPPNAALSPKQQFQSQVRELSGRPRHVQARSEPDVTSHSRRHELHHVSTLRVQHKRNASAIPSIHGAALSESSHNRHPSKTAAFTGNTVPDFSAEEREAWSKMSPKPASSSNRSRRGHRVSSTPCQQTIQPHQPQLFPVPERLEPIPQPRKQARQNPLRPFEPLQTDVEVERPKTSRGVPSLSHEQILPAANTREQETEIKQKPYTDAMSRNNHRSKFLEGSMNDRSVAVASSWYHDNTSGSEGFDDSAAPLAHDTDADSDVTPRASKLLPPTPAPHAIKKSIFKFGSGRSSDESTRTVEEVPKKAKERKEVRKSISIWSFHSLGDKIFGGSGSDATSETSADTTTDKQGAVQKDKTGSGVDIDMLNERKRKAEEAYAQQFGIKKQKSNLGLSVASTPEAAPRNKTVSNDRRPKTPTIFRRKRDQRTSDDNKRATETLEAHKRLSRRELEKENQQLRSMLRESQSMTFSRSASLTSLDLRLKGQQNFTQGPVVMVSPGKKQGRRREEIPPVPKLPDQGILAEMQNRNVLLRPGKDVEKANRGSFETIEEGEEGVEKGQSEGESSIPVPWEWPEDVF